MDIMFMLEEFCIMLSQEKHALSSLNAAVEYRPVAQTTCEFNVVEPTSFLDRVS